VEVERLQRQRDTLFRQLGSRTSS